MSFKIGIVNFLFGNRMFLQFHHILCKLSKFIILKKGLDTRKILQSKDQITISDLTSVCPCVRPSVLRTNHIVDADLGGKSSP